MPEAVYTDADGNKEVYYQHMIAYLIEMNKEQQRDINELKALNGLEVSK